MEFEEGEQGEATWFNKHHGLGSFPFSSLIFLAFVGSSVSGVVARRDTEPSQPIAPRLRYGILARVGGGSGRRGGDGEGLLTVNNNRDVARVWNNRPNHVIDSI